MAQGSEGSALLGAMRAASDSSSDAPAPASNDLLPPSGLTPHEHLVQAGEHLNAAHDQLYHDEDHGSPPVPDDSADGPETNSARRTATPFTAQQRAMANHPASGSARAWRQATGRRG